MTEAELDKRDKRRMIWFAVKLIMFYSLVFVVVYSLPWDQANGATMTTLSVVLATMCMAF